MAIFITALLVMSLALPGFASGQADVSTFCPNVVTDAVTCLQSTVTDTTLSGLLTDPSTLLDVGSLVLINSGVICQTANTLQLQAMYDCLYAKLVLCIPTLWQKAYPTVQQTKQHIVYICQNVQNVDPTCVADSSRSATRDACVVAGTPPATPTPSDAVASVAFQCSQTDLTATCTQAAYATCTGNTAALLSLSTKLQGPSGCAAGDIIRPSLILVIIPVAACVTSLFTRV
ncbi:uncharacterized protein [Haliotis cracherodii]|uniref:uncharacterized protein n=1 Tax=Haliotis cracherodii TaxID=6455 RepID=UPI0039E783FA